MLLFINDLSEIVVERLNLIAAGDAKAEENWQEEISCQQGVDALSQAHVEEFHAVAGDFRGDAQDLDRWHEAGTQRQPHGHCWHWPATGEEVIGGGLLVALLQHLVEPDGHGHHQHGAKDGVVGPDEARAGEFTAGCLIHDGPAQRVTAFHN